MNTSDSISFTVFDFSDPWIIVSTSLFICSALLSVIGSTVILFKIVQNRAQNGSIGAYDGIIAGLSCVDIFASIYYAIIPFLLARATPASCQAFGILGLLSWAATWYNGLLSYKFLMTVLSQVRRKKFGRKYELMMHFSLVYFPIVAITSYSQKWVRPNDLGTSCEFDPFMLLFGTIPIIFTFLSMIINYSVIYAIVRKSIKSSNGVRKNVLRESTTIMVLYVISYLMTWLPIICRFLIAVLIDFDAENPEETPLGQRILIRTAFNLNAMLQPLQGFFNAFIYLKPFYARFRAAYPNKSKRWVLKQALLNSKTPRLYHRRVANHITQGAESITDITFAEESAVNPNQVLFDASLAGSRFSRDLPSNTIKEEDSRGVIEEGREEEEYRNIEADDKEES